MKTLNRVPFLALILLLLSPAYGPRVALKAAQGDPRTAAAERAGTLKLVPAIAELRLLAGAPGQSIFLQSHTVSGDGGLGYFRWESGRPPRTYSDDNGTAIVPAGGDGSSAWVREHSGEISVKWYGAQGDGVTDDSAAINAAADYIRRSVKNQGVLLNFPEGTYRVLRSLNFTNIRGKEGIYWGLEGRNANILGECAGKPVFDFMRSRGGSMRGFNIEGSATSRPRCAIQLARGRYSARGTAETADNFTLEFIRTFGHFSLTALYNFGSERFLAYNCSFNNADASENSYCALLDGRNKFAAASDYFKNELPVDSPVSFLNQQFIKCSFQKSPGGPGVGPAIYMTRTSRVRMIGCYAVSYTSAAVVMDGDESGFRDIDLNLHCEPPRRIKYAVKFTSSYGAASYPVNLFRWVENALQATSAAIYSDGPVVTLTDANIQVEGRLGREPVALFSPGAKFKVFGVVSSPSPLVVLSPDLTLKGAYYRDASIASAFLPKGSFDIEDVSGLDRRFKGAQRWYGTPEGQFSGSEISRQPVAALANGSLFLGQPAGEPAVTFGDPVNETPAVQLQAFESASALRFRVTPDGGATWTPSLTILPSGAVRQPGLAAAPTKAPAGGDSFYNTATHSFQAYKGGPNPAWGDVPVTLKGGASLNFPATPAQSSSDLKISIAGAADGEEVALGAPSAAILPNSSYTAFVSAPGTVTVQFNNYSSGAQDPAPGNFRVSIIRR